MWGPGEHAPCHSAQQMSSRPLPLQGADTGWAPGLQVIFRDNCVRFPAAALRPSPLLPAFMEPLRPTRTFYSGETRRDSE